MSITNQNWCKKNPQYQEWGKGNGPLFKFGIEFNFPLWWGFFSFFYWYEYPNLHILPPVVMSL